MSKHTPLAIAGGVQPIILMNAKYDSIFAELVLKSPLTPSNSHDEEGAMMTKDGAWYFVPHADDCVRGRPTIGCPEGKLTERPRWGLEAVKCYPGGHWQPDEYDIAEVERFDSLWEAIKGAAHAELERNLCDHAMAVQEREGRESPAPVEEW